MITHYLKVFFRDIARNRVNSIINLLGLVIGLSLTFLILLYVLFELNYDKHNENYHRIYRVVEYTNNLERHGSWTPYPLASRLTEQFPDIEDYARINEVYNASILKGQEKIPVTNLVSADNSIFNLFTIPIAMGEINPITNPRTVAISEHWAEMVFGKDNPLGRSLDLILGGEKFTFTVTAVFKNLPKNSSFRPEILTHYAFGLDNKSKTINYNDEIVRDAAHYESSFEDWWFTSFVMLRKEADAEQLVQNIATIKGDFPLSKWDRDISLQPMSLFHFSPTKYVVDTFNPGNIRNVYIYSMVGVLILLIVVANYLVLSLARSATRLKEYSLRKVVGASRSKLISQTLRESFLFILLSLPFALTLVEMLLPFVNQLFKLEMELLYLENLPFILGLIGILLATGLLSSLYLALVTSRLNPAEIFRNSKSGITGGTKLMKVLISAQLVIFISFISLTLIITKQVDLMRTISLGFDKENLLSISTYFNNNLYTPLKEELLQNPNVIGVTGSMFAPPTNNKIDMNLSLQGKPETGITLEGFFVDHNFGQVMGLELLEGAFFNGQMSPNNSPVIANRALVEKWELENPIGTNLNWGTIVGVVENFHFHSLHKGVQPTALFYQPAGLGDCIVRFRTGAVKNVVEHIEEVWSRLSPDSPLYLRIADDELEKFYTEEKRLNTIVLLFGGISIFIAAMGLFGLSIFIAQRRTKELGIRKVMGASNSKIVGLLVNEFVVLVLASGLVSLPLTLLFAYDWLQDFAYRTPLSPWIFILSTLLALIIVLGTLSFQAIRVARTNPVYSLRYE